MAVTCLCYAVLAPAIPTGNRDTASRARSGNGSLKIVSSYLLARHYFFFFFSYGKAGVGWYFGMVIWEGLVLGFSRGVFS